MILKVVIASWSSGPNLQKRCAQVFIFSLNPPHRYRTKQAPVDVLAVGVHTQQRCSQQAWAMFTAKQKKKKSGKGGLDPAVADKIQKKLKDAIGTEGTRLCGMITRL